MSEHALLQAFVYLCAAVVAVPIAKRLGLGSVLGYLVAGVAIGPYVLGMVSERGGNVMHAAEFGVVMMLFLIGLELRPALLWQMRRPILGLGGAQVVATAVAVAVACAALGLELPRGLVIGMILSLSSTAIVLQSLAEKGLLGGEGGKATFSVLLFQDIAVIPMLAIVPLLGAGAVSEHGPSGVAALPAWARALIVLGAVGAVVGAGRFLVRPAFRFLAETRLREIFTAAALLLVVGIALLMTLVGLSPALGTFVAGVVLADSEYRHELEGDIEPFKGLLLGLFFISVGASIDLGLIGSRPFLILALVVALMALKMVVLALLGRMFGLARPARALLAFALGQGGEFAFVLTSFSVGAGALPQEQAGMVDAVVAASMFLTPMVLIAYERWVAPWAAGTKAAREPDEVHEDGSPVVIAGFGRFGQIVGRLLRAKGIGTTVLDLDGATVDLVRRVGLEVFYGDASRVELLHAAGCEKAKLFVLAIDDVDKSLDVAAKVRQHFPHLEILARARNRTHYYQLRRLGVRKIHRETFASALDMGVDALRALGYRAHQALRTARAFRAHDEASVARIADMAATGADQNALFAEATRSIAELERLLRGPAEEPAAVDAGWDVDSLRAEVRERSAGPR